MCVCVCVGQTEGGQEPCPCGGELPEADARSAAGGRPDAAGGEEESREGADHERGGSRETAPPGGETH